MNFHPKTRGPAAHQNRRVSGIYRPKVVTKPYRDAANDNRNPTANDLQPTRLVAMFLVFASLVLIVGLVLFV
jgi:hypothetical protein